MGSLYRRVAAGLALSVPAGAAAAQSRAVVEQERRDHAEWLRSAPLSPRRAVGVFPLGPGLTLGPASAAIPLAGVAASQLLERNGRLILLTGDSTRGVPRGRALALGAWHLLAGGPAGRTTITVFAAELRTGKPAAWYPYDPGSVFSVTLAPAPVPAGLRVLAPDGVEVEATEAGSVTPVIGGTPHTLHVRRLPGASEEESELEIYFRDATNGGSTYPAGRFVSLIPQAGDRYLLDFNRARNPFCAYNTAYPCPAPWRGNALRMPIKAGEQYRGGGLTTPPTG